MVRIYPFQGLRYDSQHVSELQPVVSPPYDVISPGLQEDLHQRSPYNIVRLILGKKQAEDNDQSNVYTRAHQVLEEWRAQGIMTEESQPALYAYTQQWEGIERRGFIALLQVEPYETGDVLPHEYTLGGPKADRLALTQATGSILSPIFCLYHDPQKQVEAMVFEHPPATVLMAEDDDGVVHRFWPITDRTTIQAIQQALAAKPALIADGHHRYETAVAYRDWRREQDNQQNAPKGSLPWDYTMSFFTNMADEGLRIYPTHRVLTDLPDGWTFESFQQALSEYFEPASEEHALFWIQVGAAGRQQAYRLKPGANVDAIPAVLQSLDVALLDQFAFQTILKQSANNLKQQGLLQFVRDEAEVQQLLSQGAMVFRVHAPDVEQVRIICESGYRMPQKSTYFYPKLLDGLVLYYYGTKRQTPNQSQEQLQSTVR